LLRISAAIFIALWKYVAIRIGIRKGFMISMVIFIITLFPNLFINNVIQGFIVFFLIGVGLAGSLFFLDITIAAVMDEDELETGVRRAGGIYGISTFILRFATIFMFLTISLVFNSTGWTVFDPIGTVNTQLGLRILIFVFPAIALIIGILAMYKFPITKEKYTEMKKELRKLHQHKLEKIRKQ
jgi:GPH family glycoside/pentoside/hexuronide:cation symporter